jgi:trigger factor
VEEKPKVKIGKYKGIKAEKKIEDVKEEEVNNVLEDLKRERTRWVDVDREAKEGDFLILDLEVYLKDKLVEKKENMGVLLDKGSLIPDMFENLVGMKKEEEKEFEVELPDDYRDEKLAGKRCKFKVKVKSIKQKEEPSLDDGFAKEIGDYKNLDELKEKIKEELKRYKERQAELDFEEKIIDRLIENSEMELPPQLLEIQTRKIAEDMIMRLIYRGIPRKEIEAQMDLIWKEANKQAERYLKIHFILEEIAEKEDIQISQDELEERIRAMAKAQNLKEEELKQRLGEKGLEDLKERLRKEKVIEFIKENAKVMGLEKDGEVKK